MAPEQWEGPEVTVQADIYALGCILGEMLTVACWCRARRWMRCGGRTRVGRRWPAVRSAPGCRTRLLAGAWRWSQVGATGTGRRGGSPGGRLRPVAGRAAPEAEAAGALSRAERVAAGWSASEMGWSYLDIGKARYGPRLLRARTRWGRSRRTAMEAAGLTNLGLAYAATGRRAAGHRLPRAGPGHQPRDLRSIHESPRIGWQARRRG